MKSVTSLLFRVLPALLLTVLFLGANTAHAQTVTGNGATITTGDVTPILLDGTAFGELLAGLETGNSEFRFSNTSGVNQTVCAVKFSSSLVASPELSEDADMSLAIGQVLPFTMPPVAALEMKIMVTFAPLDGGTHTDVIEIEYDDMADCSSPTTYTFTVEGMGILDFGDADTDESEIGTDDGARHILTGPRLGLRRDAEADAAESAIADGDDSAGLDDEDGVLFISDLPSDGLAAMVVNVVGGSGYLSAWIDADDDVMDFEEQILDGFPVSAGSQVVPFAVPTLVSDDDFFVRIRLCSTATDCDESTGLSADGEVEDYHVPGFTSAAAYTIAMPGTDLLIDLVGDDIVVTDEGGNVVFSAPLADVTMLTVNGDTTDETVTVNPDAVPAGGLTINMDGGDDALVILETSGDTGIVAHTFTDEGDGDVYVDTAHITYTGLTPITDHVTSAMRTFAFTMALPDVVVLNASGDGASGNGYSFIDSDYAEEVSFKNPTASLRIDTATDVDTVSIGLLDTPLAAGFNWIEVNTNAGADHLTVTPSDDYPVMANGGTPNALVCTGDVLEIDTSAGAVVDIIDLLSGTVTFSSGEEALSVNEFELFGNSDISISGNRSSLYAGDDLNLTPLEIYVTNNGPAASSCAGLDFGTLTNSLDDGAGITFSPPTLGVMLPGETVTVIVTGFVTNINPATHTLTGTNAGVGIATPGVDPVVIGNDPNTGNNEWVIDVHPGFAFPAKTHVNAALYVSRTSEVGGVVSDPYDKLIVGLFQGSPGFDSAVWCRIPNPIEGGGAVLFPAEIGTPGSTAYFGKRWRPCAGQNIDDIVGTPADESRIKLPYPLVVNDIFEDAGPDNLIATTGDNRIWVATWGHAGLYVSMDGAETWQAAWPNAFCDLNNTSPSNCLPNGTYTASLPWTAVYAITQDADGFLYISANDGLVFRSMNGGTTWQQVTSLPHVASDTPWSMVADLDEAGVVYAGTFGRGVYVTTDFGFSWDFLGGEVQNEVLLGNPAGDGDNPDDLYAGHIFDLEIIRDGDDYLFAGTAAGVWRTLVDATAFAAVNWTMLPFAVADVTLNNGTIVVPEVRTLVEGPAGELLIGTWGFGAFENAMPTAAGSFGAVALRGANVPIVAVSNTGELFLGTDTGDSETLQLSLSATSTSTESAGGDQVVPEGYALGQNYPNPFNPVTTIGFELPDAGKVRLAVFDVLGREVAVLVDGPKPAGLHQVRFHAAALPSGSYLYRLDTAQGTMTRQLVLMK